MIKYVLVILAMTPQGPTVQEVAEFNANNQQYCESIGEMVIHDLRKQGIKAMYRCVRRTEV